MISTATLWGSFIAGLVTSAHCVGMCGLLTCGLGIAGGGNSAIQVTGYHGGRLISYTMIGALAGAIGWLPGENLMGAGAAVPWFLVLLLVFIGLGLERYLPAVPALSRLVGPLRLRFSRLSGGRKGIAVGALTPLLPCGPLWGMFAVGLVSGSPVRGAELMLVFALGTVPLLWAFQSGAAWWQRNLSPATIRRVQRGVAIVAALVLAWRFRDSLPFIEGPAGCGCELAVGNG